MFALAKQPPVVEIGSCFSAPPTNSTNEADGRDALDDLINELAAKRQRVSALRRTLPNEMMPEAVEALCNLGDSPGAAVSGGGVKYLLSETCAKIDRDIERLCALRRNLPEDFADSLAEEGLALLVAQFCYINR